MGESTPGIIVVMYLVSGFSDAADESPDWEPDAELSSLDAAVTAGREWIANHPNGRVDVIEMFAGEGSAVRVVTRRGVEVVAALPLSRRARWRVRSARPPQVILIGVGFTLMGAWMFLAPVEINRHSPQFIRGVGLISALIFGSLTVVGVIRWATERKGHRQERPRGRSDMSAPVSAR